MPEQPTRQPRLSAERRAELRRQALQLAALLPDNEAEAIYVLHAARRIVIEFLENDLDLPRADLVAINTQVECSGGDA